jgi:hypothetical protein
MLGRLAENAPSWFFIVLMTVSGIVGWSLLNSILHGGDTFNVALYWLALVLGVLSLAVFFISTRIWHKRHRREG